MTLVFPDSALAHHYLDGLSGIEIGAAMHNPFNIPGCKFVDRTDNPNDVFKQASVKLCGQLNPVDYVAEGDDLPFEDGTWDYVLSSHVLEHFFDPIKALKEWYRVLKPGGYIFMIVPKVDSAPGEDRPPASLQELIDRHEGRIKPEEVYMGGFTSVIEAPDVPLGEHGHWAVYSLESLFSLCRYLGYRILDWEESDTKVGNGHTIVIQK
jgi:SAM-dependent methyltransferase